MSDASRAPTQGSTMLIATEPQMIACTELACTAANMTLQVVSELRDVSAEAADVVLCPDDQFPAFRELRLRMPVLVYGSTADSARAIEAIKHGAVDYLVPPFDTAALAGQLAAALRLARDPVRPADFDSPPDSAEGDVDRIIGQSPAMQDVYKAIGRIAPSMINVLITGESGTGKELIARAIVHHSPRRDGPYLAVNCAAIPDTLLESELFGHERGAFTGADQRRVGKFEQCHGGTLFLDEIGDIPLATQAKLLRVLQDQSFQRLGGSEIIRCDVRLIAATHQPLDQLMAERRFRPDLFYRLNVATIHVPPLREREVDVVLLAHYFVDRYNAEFRTHIRAFAPETLRVLLQQPWPGNVRQLENAVRAALVMAQGSVLRPEFLPASIRGSSEQANDTASGARSTEDPDAPVSTHLAAVATARLGAAPPGDSVFHDAVADLERELIRAALRLCAGRIAPAAKRLGISRTTLRRKMESLGIDITTT